MPPVEAELLYLPVGCAAADARTGALDRCDHPHTLPRTTAARGCIQRERIGSRPCGERAFHLPRADEHGRQTVVTL